jgi:hypothetical protein
LRAVCDVNVGALGRSAEGRAAGRCLKACFKAVICQGGAERLPAGVLEWTALLLQGAMGTRAAITTIVRIAKGDGR